MICVEWCQSVKSYYQLNKVDCNRRKVYIGYSDGERNSKHQVLPSKVSKNLCIFAFANMAEVM